MDKVLKEHELCVQKEAKVLAEMSKVQRENDDLHGWVERETNRYVEQSTQIEVLTVTNKTLNSELEIMREKE